ncbi:hypothetical protein ONS96_000305 [Cadophora gregata f. sp. sojae]|nr:hypothetical protein ONS96_000305 [Cadophora gregata f. sp. sojae]
MFQFVLACFSPALPCSAGWIDGSEDSVPTLHSPTTRPTRPTRLKFETKVPNMANFNFNFNFNLFLEGSKSSQLSSPLPPSRQPVLPIEPIGSQATRRPALQFFRV